MIDGIQENHGRILVVTTNRYDEIDPALLRDGRIDIKINMENADIEIVNDVYNHFFHDNLPYDFYNKNKDISIMPSKLINFCKLSNEKEEFLDILDKFNV